MPAGFIFHEVRVVIEAVPCHISREKGNKKTIWHCYMLMTAALEAAGFKIIHRSIDEKKHEASIWCAGSKIEKS